MMSPEGRKSPAIDGVARDASVAEYVALMKPGLTTMSVCTAAGGAYLGADGHPPATLILNLVLGTFLVGAGAAALNQLIERRSDALMKRKEQRPIPSGALTPLQGLVMGLLCAGGGIAYLFLTTTALAGTLALVTVLVYLLLYTPLKRVTHLSTAIGGIPGALPPVIGWVAVGRGFSLEAYLLFLFLFMWQMPHFLSLAWMYRRDYSRGGYRLLPEFDASGGVTGRLTLLYCAALTPVAISLALVGLMGWIFLGGALIAGGLFLAVAYRFAAAVTNENARRVFLASLVYLSVILALMLIDRVALA
jgi:protoheme IX farnesyltransferase